MKSFRPKPGARNIGHILDLSSDYGLKTSRDQFERLSLLKFNDGEYILDEEKESNLIEIFGMLISQPFEEVEKFLSSVKDEDELIWNQKSMKKSTDKFKREMEYYQREEKGIKGVGKCKHCQSTELAIAKLQTSGGDEATTIFYRCVRCGMGWRG